MTPESGRTDERCDHCGSDGPLYRQATVGGSYTVRCYDEPACAGRPENAEPDEMWQRNAEGTA